MSRTEREALRKLGREVHEWFTALSPAEKVERLKESGILDLHGTLSSTYGGEGEPTRVAEADSRSSATR